MKTYLMSVKAWRTIIVEAQTEDEALDRIGDEFHIGDWELDEIKVEKELKTDAEQLTSQHHGAMMLEDC